MKGSAFEIPPPGAGLKTVTCAVPVVATSLAGMDAWSCVALTKVVVRSAPFQRTTEDEMKLLPVTVRVKAGPPAVALLGERELRMGVGSAGVATGVFISVWISAWERARL